MVIKDIWAIGNQNTIEYPKMRFMVYTLVLPFLIVVYILNRDFDLI